MIIQNKREPRIEYLTRVLVAFMENNSEICESIDYDGATCDGSCLAQDFADEVGIDTDLL